VPNQLNVAVTNNGDYFTSSGIIVLTGATPHTVALINTTTVARTYSGNGIGAMAQDTAAAFFTLVKLL
jgi:hypothetical protein